jgi:hypothetical protein
VRRALRTAVPLVVIVALLATVRPLAQAPAPAPTPELTREQMREFMLKAKVVKSKDVGKGVTHPYRLTLSDGTLTHDAVFQSVDEKSTFANLKGTGGAAAEINFVDTYRYNLGAEVVATLLGVEYMIPVHAERMWNGKKGSLSWWVENMMDEGERLKKGVKPPNPDAWNKQMYRMRVFSALVRDTDRNLTNVLITSDWKIVMIDFTRAFRLQPIVASFKDLPMCDRGMFEKMKGLTKDGIRAASGDYLNPNEIEAVLKRRDLLVTHFEGLVKAQGEDAVLY